MRGFKKAALLVLILAVVFQFVQPEKNRSEGLGDADISKVYNMPADLHQTLVNKCYDCHSNNTRYPWYFNIQPIGWWLAAHVHEGKEQVNFSEFRNYPAKKANHALEELKEVTEEGSMPLDAYVMLHEDAKLTEADKKAIIAWINSVAPGI
jgi:hypothetical protein